MQFPTDQNVYTGESYADGSQVLDCFDDHRPFFAIGHAVLALPVFNISYGRFFLGNAGAASGAGAAGGLGMNAYQDSHWRVGAVLSSDLEAPRKVANDPEDLHGLGDISRTTRATLFAAHTLDWVTARTTFSADIGAWDLGARASLSRLRGSAAESPITEARTQSSYIMFAEYEF